MRGLDLELLMRWDATDRKRWLEVVESAFVDFTTNPTPGPAPRQRAKVVERYLPEFHRLFVHFSETFQPRKCLLIGESLAQTPKSAPEHRALWNHEAAVWRCNFGYFAEAQRWCEAGLIAARKAGLGSSSPAARQPHKNVDDSGAARLLRLAPGHLHHRLAYLYAVQGDTVKARKNLKQALKLKSQLQRNAWVNVEMTSTRSALAVMDELEGRFAPAAEQQRAVKDDAFGAHEFDFGYRLARTLRRCGQYSSALEATKGLLKKAEDAQACRNLLRLRIEQSLSYLLRDESGDASEARNQLKAAARLIHGKLQGDIGAGASVCNFYLACQLLGFIDVHHHTHGLAFERVRDVMPVGISHVLMVARGIGQTRNDTAELEPFHQARLVCELLLNRKSKLHDIRYWLSIAEAALGLEKEAMQTLDRAIRHCGEKGVRDLAIAVMRRSEATTMRPRFAPLIKKLGG